MSALESVLAPSHPLRCALCGNLDRCTDPGSPQAAAVQSFIEFVHSLREKGGPDPADYSALTAGFARLVDELRGCGLERRHVCQVREAFGDALGPGTMQGHALHKPHGYAGDYEIIDRIYTHHVSPDPALRKWDVFFHAQDAPNAVRNRKLYFESTLQAILTAPSTRRDPILVLNVGCGPGRDLLDFFERHPAAHIHFHCIDTDPAAISHASSLCASYLDRITFHTANAFRFRSPLRFDLIWSAGLFDYLTDTLFCRLLRRLKDQLGSDGELVIGNFAPSNALRPYMEVLGEWVLRHRSVNELLSLAGACGVAGDLARVGHEPCGVNLFLHVRSGEAGIAT